MKYLNGITSQPDQTFFTALDDGSIVTIRLVFRPRIQKFFADITYGSFQLNSIRVCNVPNILEQFSNIIPFGLFCFVSDNAEPFLINDFVSGRCQLYLLNQADLNSLALAYAGLSS